MNVSTAIKNAYKNGSHAKVVTISFPNLNYTVPTDEVYYESMTLDEAIFDSDSFEIVGCIASQFEVQIRDTGENLKGELVTVSIAIEDIQDSSIPLFYGYVDTVDKVAQKKMQKITAYDPLYSKGSMEVADWYEGLTFPITLKDFRDSLFTFIGLTQETTTLPNDDIAIQKEYSPNTLKALSVIKSLCQINGCFGMMSRQGVFEYRFLTTTGTAESVSYYRSMDYKDYVVNPVDKLTIRQTSNDSGVSIGSGTNTYIIQGNMFTYNMDASTVYTIATNIYNYIKDIEYIPFEASNNGYPWVELGKDAILSYSVYDFDNSTPSSVVYKDVTVVAMKRTMKGIQNLTDTYNAEGKELQQEFLSSIDFDLSVLQEQVENIVSRQATEISTYRNAKSISINSDGNAVIADMMYEASEGNTIIFHEEVCLIATPTVIGTSVSDVVVTARYYVNGYRLSNHVSEGKLLAGKNILSLMQFWEASDVDKNRVQVILTVEGGNVQIAPLRANAYITVKQTNYKDAYIEVTKMPYKTIYNLGETLDFTGLEVKKIYEDNTASSEVITTRCTYNPSNGSTVVSDDLIVIHVTYVETSELGVVKTYETDFNLSTRYLTGISVEQEPTKTEYYIGENLNLNGIKVVADYIDGSTADVTNSCTYSPANGYTFTSTDEGEIQISYTESGVTAETSTFVTVGEVIPEMIQVTTPPNITTFEEEQTLDYTGIVVTCYYNNGTSVDVTASCTFNPANGSAATINQETVEVTYIENNVELTTEFNIIVKPLLLKYIEYTRDDSTHTIIIERLKTDDIYNDRLKNFYIPTTYTINNVPYEVHITSY